MAFTPTSWTNGSGAAINATNLNNISNALAQNVDYQTPTVVGQEIRLTRYSTSDIFKFYLSTAVTGGAITISTDGGATSVALKNGAGEAVTELNAGLVEVAYVTPFFILRSSGGLDSFFGDGSDGTIPNLNTVTSAPNGGTVANLWDMNAGTVFTTGTLSSASDQVVFSIDFGNPQLISSGGSITGFGFSSISISTGANRNLALEYSDDSISWTQSNISVISTTPSGAGINGVSTPHRYWRTVLRSGGSTCTLSINEAVINYSNTIGDTYTNKVMRILEPSTLNGAAVVKQYTDFNLPAGYELTVQNPNQGLVIYSQNGITNAGVIDMSQKAGLAPNGNIIPMLLTKVNSSDVKTIDKYFKLTTVLQVLKGGSGGNGGYGGGYSGSTGRQTSVGIGGAGRQNLGGFGGGGSGGASVNASGGIGGSILNAEIGGGKTNINQSGTSTLTGVYARGENGSGGIGNIQSISNISQNFFSGIANGGGSGGMGGSNGSRATTGTDSQYSGGFIIIICGGILTNNGIIKADGGSGGNGTNSAGANTGGGGGGGGAGGGVIALFYGNLYSNTGTVQANGGAGGTGGAGVGTGEAGGTASSGSSGQILTQKL